MDPVRTARWLCQELDKLGKAQVFADAFNQALASGGNRKPMG
jgi:hypothetical protein